MLVCTITATVSSLFEGFKSSGSNPGVRLLRAPKIQTKMREKMLFLSHKVLFIFSDFSGLFDLFGGINSEYFHLLQPQKVNLTITQEKLVLQKYKLVPLKVSGAQKSTR